MIYRKQSASKASFCNENCIEWYFFHTTIAIICTVVKGFSFRHMFDLKERCWLGDQSVQQQYSIKMVSLGLMVCKTLPFRSLFWCPFEKGTDSLFCFTRTPLGTVLVPFSTKKGTILHFASIFFSITRNKGMQSLLMCEVQSWNTCMEFDKEIKIGPIYERCNCLILLMW